MITKEAAYKKISELVDRFEEQFVSYKKSDYNETLTRRDFIDPFFKALGWDIDNEEGYAQSYREVIHEDKVKIGRATKAPDYSFRLSGGKRLFFVEAKKPSISIKDEIQPAYQVRRYGWNAKLSISIISDFEEFSIYDCTRKPSPTDRASVARIKYINYKDYLKEFDFIWDTFSKERVLKGSFDKFIQGNANKKGTATVDKEFLISLNSWRTYLATSISLRNKELNEDEVNFAVQQTIDRLIFLRIAEDRGVEPYGNLQVAIKQGDYYQNLFSIFKEADDKYNSGLFNLKKDQISQHLKIDNKVIKTILNEMYYPLSPYEFSVLPVEILGSAYEQFLGKVIRITPAHHAVIEDKPEVRKAGGVYYTPQYIVEYVVRNTIGRLIEGKKPDEISKIRIVDPACGSGSFLIGAYQYLLDFHKDYYSENGKPSKGKKNNPLTPEGNLTTAEKKRILLNNIYGVDIDVNAVEVTKLSLLLKCMEGETSASISHQLSMFHERVLPSLENNIKDGNSLVDMDYGNGLLDFGEIKHVRPFSWEMAFPEVFSRNVEIDKRLLYKKQFHKVEKLYNDTEKLIESLTAKEPQEEYKNINSGFDVVIGNPPYVKVSDKEVINYFDQKYTYQDYQQDLYLLFLERYKKLLVTGGKLGVIIPNTWLQSIKFKNIRRYLMNQYYWERILDIKEHIFKAVVDTHVLIFEKNDYIKNSSLIIDTYRQGKIEFFQELNQNNLPDNGDVINVVSNDDEKLLFEKIKGKSVFIKDVSKIYNGVKPFEKGKGTPPQTNETMKLKPFVKVNQPKPSGENWLPLMRGSLMNKYENRWNHNSWIQYGEWLAAPRDKKIFEAEEKIIIRQTGDSIIATIIGKDIICRNNLHILIANKLNHKFILGVLNSKLTDFYYYQINPERGEALAEVKKDHVEQLPLPGITEENQSAYNQIISYVEQLLQLHKELQTENLESKKVHIESRIRYCESKLNEQVYRLYELTENEINIVEGK
ncbi:MAG: N-6 DNA methylase [Bacteroidales bacterium]|nr:N-6 DNA methylase [Bacteroidales bacterium]